MKDRICFVVQRYGLEINGGAELLCRLYAEHLKNQFKIEVLTTKAIDYVSWKDEYKNDVETINGVNVKRFNVLKERNQKEFNIINAQFLKNGLSEKQEHEWIEKQGPYAPSLINYLKEHQYDYDIIIFFTYLYYPTVMGIKNIAQKSIVMPFAHDEPFLKMSIFNDVFLKPNGIVYSTEEEKKLINQRFYNEKVKSIIGGCGLDLPPNINPDSFKKQYELDKFVVYIGRIDSGKNCHELFSYFIEYKKRNPSDLKLLLLGKPVMEIPHRKDIVSLGFVSDQDKFNCLAGASALILPSHYESLSMVVLEAMAVKTPVIVNGSCDVLKGHCIKSNGAFYYNNFFEFEGELKYLLNPSNRNTVEQMKENAKAYVDSNYQWETIIKRFSHLIENICGENNYD